MEITKPAAQNNNYLLLQMLDKGIDDMLANHELPLEEAFRKITDLRNKNQQYTY